MYINLFSFHLSLWKYIAETRKGNVFFMNLSNVSYLSYSHKKIVIDYKIMMTNNVSLKIITEANCQHISVGLNAFLLSSYWCNS